MSDRIYSDDPEQSTENIVLVAQACKGVLTKRNSPVGQRSYDNVTFYNFFEVHIDSLDELYMLCVKMLDKPRCCFVRARVKDEEKRFRVRRNYKGEDATLILQNFNWFALDIDWDFESSGDLVTDANSVLLALPSCFTKVECFVVASASYGIKPGIRMRMFFWSRAAVSNLDLKRLLSGYEKIADPAIFNPVQPIYTAKPIFVDMIDPIQQRIASIIPFGYFSNAVEVPASYQHEKGMEEQWYTKRKAEAFFRKKLVEIAELPPGERHNGIVKVGYLLGKLTGQGHFDRDEMIQSILDACSYWTGKRDIRRDTETITWTIDKGIDAMYKEDRG